MQAPNGSSHAHSSDVEWENAIEFYLNGRHIRLPQPPVDSTLLQYLRSPQVGLTGTKLGCGEGGCGACTVLASHFDLPTQRVVHRAINACIAPLCSIDGHAIVTVEGIGSWRNMHALQERLVGFHGSQCGFCTPGILMALYAFLRSHPYATQADIEESFDGNLCRCTGYRSILDAAKSFGSDYKGPAPGEVVTGRVCPSTGLPCSCARLADQGDNPGEAKIDFGHGGTDPIFPPALKRYVPRPLLCHAPGSHSEWYRPTTLADLLRLKVRLRRNLGPGESGADLPWGQAKHSDAKLTVGSTEVTIEVNLKRTKHPYRVQISPAAISEMNSLKVCDDGVEIGAAVSLSRVSEFLRGQIQTLPEEKSRAFAAIVEQLKYFAGHQIRNVACLGGNIATASPISDINPVLLALGAQLSLASHAHPQPRRLEMDRSFFVSYRKISIDASEVIVSVWVPFTRPLEFVQAYKQARRKDDDIAITSGAFRTSFKQVDGKFLVDKATLVYGGMAPITKMASVEVADYLSGKEWSDATMAGLYKLLEKDFALDPHAPGGMIAYRRTLVLSFYYKYFLYVSQALGMSLDPRVTSAVSTPERPVSSGSQTFQPLSAAKAPVGEPLSHMSGAKQVTGEAQYVDDIPRQANELFAAFVFSDRAHAKILALDATAAKAYPGVEAFYCAADIPGANQIGPAILDEELFASQEVLCIGFPIGIIVAKTQAQAQQAAKLVKVTYEDLPAVLTIPEAIAAQSFHSPDFHKIQRGDVDAAWAKCDVVVSGELEMGGQEHFYLETQGSLVVPGEEDELTIYSSTQNPNKTQMKAASVLGISANRVVCRTKRMGGGFGGKETRSLYVSTACALAAYKTRKPVRMILDRDEDMLSSGGRNPFSFVYKAGATRDGQLQALDVQVYVNAGCTYDLSLAVGDRALFHVDNAYYLPNVRAVAVLCKTHLPTNTAFRGFGGPQGMMIAETYMTHLARELKMSPNALRQRNFYQNGQRTHYTQLIEDYTVPRLWTDMLRLAEIESREKEIAQFNRQHRWRKRGLAAVPVKFGMSFTLLSMNQASALVHIYGDGTVLVSHGGTEMGQGLHTKIIQISAQALGIPVAKVFISETSTDKIPNASPTAASVSSDINGQAVFNACQELSTRLAPIRAKHPSASWEDLIKYALGERVDLSAHGFYATPDIGYDFASNSGRPFAYYTCGTGASEVEIDCLTGDLTVVRTDIVMDVGESLNPALDIGQIEGAFAQGFGLTTLEEVVFDDRFTRTPGKVFTRGPSTYKLPGFKDIPLKLNVHLLPNVTNLRAIHSSKGIGEPPLFLGCSVFFAIREAIAAAREEVGRPEYFPLASPATCERIRMACQDPLTAHFDS